MIKITLITPITILVGSFILYLVLRNINIIVSDIYLFFMFLFAYPNVEPKLATFYLFGILFMFIVDFTNQPFEVGFAKKLKLAQFKFAGFSFMLISLAIGAVMYFMISLMGTRTGNIIIGVPVLATVTTHSIVSLFMPTYTALLGIVENRVFFTLFHVLQRFGVLLPVIGFLFTIGMPVLPILITSLIFAFFHLTAFSIAWSALIWATFAFMLFIVSYLVTGDTLAADSAHFFNNAAVSVSRMVRIVT